METGGEAVPDPVADAVNSPRNIEQEKLGRCPHTENSEGGQPDKTEAVKPLCCAEQMVEIPTCQDCSPKRNTDLDAFLQMSRGRGEEPVGLEVHGIQTADNAVPHRALWGEEMSGVSCFHSPHISQNKVLKAALQSIQHSSNSGLNLSMDRVGPTDFSSSTRDQLKSEALAALSHRGKGSSRLVAPEDTSSNLEEVHNHSFGSTSIPAGSAEGDDPALLAMFRAVANSRLAVRSQQKDEPDFTPAQKLAILRDLYKAKPLVFLERFRAALKEEHLSCFQHLMGNYEADFYCAEVRRAGLGKTRHTRVRNKRYAALQQLIRGGEYFSDEQMRSREPLLYEQYIGQYLSNDELQALDSCKREASHCLSGVLLDSYQEEVIQRRLQVQQEQEEACEEEEEEDSDEDHDEDQSSNSEMDEWAPDPEEKAFLREEFTSRMYQRFLEGQDRDFNYSEVDENPDFDNLDIVSRDEEERYFDGEDPGEAEAMEAE